MRRIILASASPRRKELLAKTGLEFEVLPADIDEEAVIRGLCKEEGEASFPARAVEALSWGKAEAAVRSIEEGLVIGADTIVWDQEILGKPRDKEDASRMLRQLQGRTHSVFTGVTLLSKKNGRIERQTFSCETEVDVYPMTEEETETYLNTGEPMDKAGAYGIQGTFSLWVKAIRGDYNCVVGLPLSALWQRLKRYL